jgi:predicted phosphodiesterase
MKLGILADIHENVPMLRAALAQLEEHEVDRVVVLGDVLELGDRLAECVELLREAKADCVWGNHDFNFCMMAVQRHVSFCSKHSSDVIDFLARMSPRTEMEDCSFTHVEPWRDLYDPSHLWHLDGPPRTRYQLSRSFRAVSSRVVFVGHFHRWQAATPRGLLEWQGGEPLMLNRPHRHFVAVSALLNGRFAVFDTQTKELTPFDVRGDAGQSIP